MADAEAQNKKENESSEDDRPQDGKFTIALIPLEFTFFHQIYKMEDRKLYNHASFEAVVVKFWRLLKKCERGSIGFTEYHSVS